MEIVEIAFVALFGLLIQFVAAILGPKVLKAATMLLILAALGIAGYLASIAMRTQFAGIGHDAVLLATHFGIIAALLLAGYWLMRRWFLAMARAAQA